MSIIPAVTVVMNNNHCGEVVTDDSSAAAVTSKSLDLSYMGGLNIDQLDSLIARSGQF